MLRSTANNRRRFALAIAVCLAGALVVDVRMAQLKGSAEQRATTFDPFNPTVITDIGVGAGRVWRTAPPVVTNPIVDPGRPPVRDPVRAPIRSPIRP